MVTGVSGAGKSTLIEETLYPALRQRITKEAPTASPFTDLTGGDDPAHARLPGSIAAGAIASVESRHLLEGIRRDPQDLRRDPRRQAAKLRRRPVQLQRRGRRCNACQGAGVLAIDMQFLPDVLIRCPECRGTRYRPEILEITYRGRNIAEVLDLTGANCSGSFVIAARCNPGSARCWTSVWTT